MNLSKAKLNEIIASAVAQALGQAQTTGIAAVKQSSGRPRSIAPAGVDYAVTIGGKDGRPRLSKEMFKGHDTITINGHAVGVNAEGRSRLPLIVSQALGARAGDRVLLKHVGGFNYTATIEGKAGQTAVAASANKRANARTEDVGAFFGGVNENYPVGDPRRSMTRKERKAFNRSPEGKRMFAAGLIAVVQSSGKPQAAPQAQAATTAAPAKRERTQAQKDATARMLAAKAAKKAQTSQVVSTGTTAAESRSVKTTPEYVKPKRTGAVSRGNGRVRFNVPAGV